MGRKLRCKVEMPCRNAMAEEVYCQDYQVPLHQTGSHYPASPRRETVSIRMAVKQRGLSLCHHGDPALPTPQANKLPALIKGRKHRRQKGRATVREIGKWPSYLCYDGTACT